MDQYYQSRGKLLANLRAIGPYSPRLAILRTWYRAQKPWNLGNTQNYEEYKIPQLGLGPKIQKKTNLAIFLGHFCIFFRVFFFCKFFVFRGFRGRRVPNPPGANPLVAERAPWRSSQSCVTGGQQPIGNPYKFLSFLLHTWQPLCDPSSHSWGRLFQLPGGWC